METTEAAGQRQIRVLG